MHVEGSFIALFDEGAKRRTRDRMRRVLGLAM
jgi:hypothetical protein